VRVKGPHSPSYGNERPYVGVGLYTQAKRPMQVKVPMKVKGPTEAKGPTKVNFQKRGGGENQASRHIAISGVCFSKRHNGMAFMRKEVGLRFPANQRSVGMAPPHMSHFQPWADGVRESRRWWWIPEVRLC